MAVQNVKKSIMGTGLGYQSDDGKQFSKDATEKYTVTVDFGDGENVALLGLFAYGVYYGIPYQADYWLRAKRFKVQKIAPTLYEIDVTYEQKQASQNGSPLDQPPVIKFSFVESEEEVDQDANGDAIVTACNEIVPLKVPYNDLLMTVEFNAVHFPVDLARQYMGGRGAVNSDTVCGQPPGTARLRSFEGESQTEGDFVYWKIHASVQFRYGVPGITTDDKAWYRRWIHKGFMVISVATAEPVRARDTDGKLATTPMLLDASGYKITDPALAVWKETQIFQSLPFSALGIFPTAD